MFWDVYLITAICISVVVVLLVLLTKFANSNFAREAAGSNAVFLYSRRKEIYSQCAIWAVLAWIPVANLVLALWFVKAILS